MSHDKATQIIQDGKGTHFDPEIVDASDANAAIFNAIRANAHSNDSHQLEFMDIESAARSFMNENFYKRAA